MGDALTKAPAPNPTWGYSKDEPEGRIFEDGKLKKGYYPSPAMVPGSDAEKRYRDDAAREGASVPWDPAPQAAPTPQSAAAPAPASDGVPASDKAK